MTDIPEFVTAVESFRLMLLNEGLPGDIRWVFRDETWFATHQKLVVRSKASASSTDLASKVYEEGRAKGLVELIAIGQGPSVTFATVWFPKFPEDEVQGWSQGWKLSIRQPCGRAILAGALLWTLVRWLPGFKRYQRDYASIGTRAWAAA